MLRLTSAFACLVASAMPSFAQKAEIEAVNAKWVEFFNKADFAALESLYTEDATALPPGSGMLTGREPIGAMWKNIAGQAGDPHITSIDVKLLGPSAARVRRANQDDSGASIRMREFFAGARDAGRA